MVNGDHLFACADPRICILIVKIKIIMSLLLFVTISLVLCSIATGFALSPLLRRINAPKTVTIRHQSLSSAAMLPSFNLAEGLDAETLQALSDVNDISDAVADAATGPQSNAVAGKLCSCHYSHFHSHYNDLSLFCHRTRFKADKFATYHRSANSSWVCSDISLSLLFHIMGFGEGRLNRIVVAVGS